MKKKNTIPIHLITEILSRLPAKSIARFRYVSKLWRSIISRQDFTELFLTRSSASPRLLIGFYQNGDWNFFSTPQPQNHPYEKSSSSLVVTADFHSKFSGNGCCKGCRYASGLIYLPGLQISKKYKDSSGVICNPSTGHYVMLPPESWCNGGLNLLGFDPIGKQFKILFMADTDGRRKFHYIMTLGEKVRWRKIQGPLTHDVKDGEICIDGVLYYLAQDSEYPFREYVYLGCFDVRSEKFYDLVLDFSCSYTWSSALIDYKGKLGVISFEYDENGGFPLQLRMWVLEDFKKEKWSKYVYSLRADNEVFKVKEKLFVVGVTASGDIVLGNINARKPFYVFYYNPERNTLLSVEIQGVGDWFQNSTVCAFVDHVDDFRFDIVKTRYGSTSISPPEQ